MYLDYVDDPTANMWLLGKVLLYNKSDCRATERVCMGTCVGFGKVSRIRVTVYVRGFLFSLGFFAILSCLVSIFSYPSSKKFQAFFVGFERLRSV